MTLNDDEWNEVVDSLLCFDLQVFNHQLLVTKQA